jgi:hypothetical protein
VPYDFIALIKYKAELALKNYRAKPDKVKSITTSKISKYPASQISHHTIFPAVVRSRSKSLNA